ncbi:tRNA pseudouridine(38-40) synthase TruA [Zhihengliuella flava]|uniref:tRNA pseudouridine synthase A n=1 Tax=Zhihengliuella flava TaxID=1285193 RepID=A0A931GG54_9MICC|nr:tRNA pseudouridine(38-40) synthase TruA [Zhihengliuella flava]MBG6085412.1 tRNA pseudouridine38-40 synthase [Zhihengliuella flava]
MTSHDALHSAGFTVAEGATEPALVRLKVTLAYDGSEFSGWARQPGLATVQGRVEDGLELLIRRPVRITVAGRTDAGVHARGQVIHFDLTSAEFEGLSRGRDLPPAQALTRRLRGVLARHGQAILIRSAEVADPGFDARFSALARRYSYRIADGTEQWDPLTRGLTLWHPEKLDVAAMNEATALVLGRHDFLSFCKPRAGATTIRTLESWGFERAGDGIITVRLEADAFCHNMVRALIGASLKVGSGAQDPAWLRQRLVAQVRDSHTVLAPPHPLVLEDVLYPEAAELARRAEQTRARRSPGDTQPL